MSNPEDNSGSFSNPLPSEGNNSSGSKQPRRPKEQNPDRTNSYDKEGNQEICYSLSSNKKVKIGLWSEKNLILVHLREYFRDGGRDVPTKKGVALTTDQWRRLEANIDDISDDVADYEDSMREESSFISRGSSTVFQSSQHHSNPYGASRLTG